VPTTPALTASPASIGYGRQVTLTATLTPSTAQQNHLPTGTVTFSNGSTIVGTGTLANGVASFNTTSLPVGANNLTAAYSGDTNFAASTSSAAVETVGELASATILTVLPNPASPGQAVTLSAAVAGTGFGSSTTPSGAIAFYDGAFILAPATLDATGQATYTASTLALGTHTLTAVYAGSAVFSGSTSNAVSEIVVKPDFSLTLSSPAVGLQTYQHTTTTVTLTSVGAFADNLTLACANPPAYVTCIFTPSPAALAGSGTAAVSFYLDTDSILGGDGLNGPLRASRGQAASSIGLALLLAPFSVLAALAGRRRLWPLLIAVLVLPAMLALGGCGGNVVSPVLSAAPGIYVIPVTATGAATGLTHTAQLTLTVSP
jgi:hypothetical protein